jgi:predicted dehydrogenase
VSADLRAIVVGVGGRGRSHLDAWLAHPRLGVTGLVDINLSFLEEARRVAGLPEGACFTTLAQAMAAVPADTVVIANHAPLHAQFIREALGAGKHVVVEKPMTCSLAEAEDLVRLADQRGVKLMVTQQMRYMPVERTIRRLVAQRAYGRLGFGHYVNYKPRGEPFPLSDNMQVWQQSVHEFDAMLAMIGRSPARVWAREFQPSWGDWPSDSSIAAMLEFEGGPTISWMSSSDARAWGLEFRLECERGTLIHRAQRLGGPGTLGLATRDGERPLPIDPGVENREATHFLADLFLNYVVEGVEPEISGAGNLPTLRLCDAVLRASRTGCAVELSERR